MPDPAGKEEYTRADVRRMLGISEQQLRGWERQGLIPATGVFGFSDLISLRTLQKLRESHIPAKKIGRALRSLKAKLAGVTDPLAELRIVSDGRHIAVQMANEKMEAISGQYLFNFETSELGGLRTLKPRQAPEQAREREAEAHFQNGLGLEETGAPIDQAIAAYEKAVELNPQAAGALVNLGTIEYRRGKFKSAEQYYQRAVAVDPRYALAHFNLGNLYDELGRAAQAEEHYGRALEINPGYADAHFNLALLSERRGDPLSAVRHWKAYLRHDRTSSWADIARRELEKLKDATVIRTRS